MAELDQSDTMWKDRPGSESHDGWRARTVKAASQNTARGAQAAQSRRRVHTITDRFSMANTHLIEDARIVIVNPGSELNARLTIHYLRRFLQRSPAEIDLIVLSHLHPEHEAGLAYLRRTLAVPVAASAAAHNVPTARCAAPDGGAPHLAGQLLHGRRRPLDHTSSACDAGRPEMADLWLEDVAGLPYHPDWRVIASPAHTPQSLCLYNPFTRELLCGDSVIAIEGRAPLLRGAADSRLLQETLRTLRSLEVCYLYPGRGRPILAQRPFANASLEW